MPSPPTLLLIHHRRHPAQVALRTGRPMVNMVMGINHSGGELVWISANAVVLRDPYSGEVTAAVAPFFDISDRKRAEAERERLHQSERAARAEAERASRMKGEFLATLSHELRTPVTPVLLTVSLMESHPGLPGDLREDVATIRRNVELESRLISDLLDLTRVESGKLRLEEQDVEGAALGRARHGAETKGRGSRRAHQ